MEAIETRKYCDGDNSFATATNLGPAVVYSSTNSSLASNSDPKDFYKFTVPLAAQSNAIKVSGLSSDANLYLYKADHTQIASSKKTGTQSETLNVNLTPGGTYYIEVRCTSGNTNYKLQVSADKAGNSRPEASDWGTLSTNGVSVGWTDYVGTLDGADYIKFTTQASGVTKIGLSALTGDANVKLLKPDGTTIALADNGGTTSEQISVNLTAGTYYAKVLPANSAVNASYLISITAPSPVDPGETHATAEDLGTLGSSTITRKGTVATTDPADFFKFKVTGDSVVSATLSNMSGDCDLSLWDANGNFLASSTRYGTGNDDVLNGLKAGTYFLRVVPGDTSFASYTLTLSRTAPSVFPDQAGNTMATAKTITINSGDKASVNDAIINRFDQDDYYKVTTTGPGNLIALVHFMSDDLDVDILNANGAVVASGNQVDKAGDSALVQVSGAGTYYIHVKQHTTGAFGQASKYTLNLQVPQDEAGNTIATAKQITSPFSTTSTIGGTDKWDYYQITVPSASYITMKLHATGNNATLNYFNSDGSIVGADLASPGVDGELSYFLHSGGVRYVAVSREASGFATYTLDVKTQAF
jgi:hypothetical protein